MGPDSFSAFTAGASVGMAPMSQPIGAARSIAPAMGGDSVPNKLLHPSSFTATLLVVILATVGLASASGAIRVGPVKTSGSIG